MWIVHVSYQYASAIFTCPNQAAPRAGQTGAKKEVEVLSGDKKNVREEIETKKVYNLHLPLRQESIYLLLREGKSCN